MSLTLQVCIRCCALESWAYMEWGVTALDLLVDFLGKAFGREEEAGAMAVGVLISEVRRRR
jgi:hypothetical protein